MSKIITLSAHQSQFIPWFPYFRKVAVSDVFVWMDCVQFQRKGLQNRNKIWSSHGELWFTLPVRKNDIDARINEMRLVDKNVGDKRWITLERAYGKAPYWKNYVYDLRKIFCDCEYIFLDDINWAFFNYVLSKFSIATRVVRLSSLNIQTKKSDLILDICRSQGAAQYISGMGGKGYLREDDFYSNHIKIEYLPSISPIYSQHQSPEIRDLSFLDMMMNCSPENIREFLMVKG